jgi:ferredoxin
MLVIDPDECIDCGVCEPECPAEAIKVDTTMTEELQFFLDYAKETCDGRDPVTEKVDAYPDADEMNPVLNTSVGNKRHLI